LRSAQASQQPASSLVLGRVKQKEESCNAARVGGADGTRTRRVRRGLTTLDSCVEGKRTLSNLRRFGRSSLVC
jgi:hypothetical protein